MPIVAVCPNGHKLTCPDRLAGQAATCPKCKAPLRIPAPGENGEPKENESPFDFLTAPAPEPQADAESPPPQVRPTQGGAVLSPAQIVFLCPNGHRLHGPASLVGRPGQCPHCKAKFLVPSPDDVVEEDEEVREGDVDLELGPEASMARDDEPPIVDVEEVAEAPGSRVGPPSFDFLQQERPSADKSPPLARLFARLWAARTPGMILELHLGDGKLLVPDAFAAAESRETHGLFAVSEPSGTHTLTAVAWDAITRLTIRGARELPRGMFNE